MRESVGKRLARNLFYRTYLPEWLSKTQLRSGNFLILLGEEPREIPLLDELRVPRSHIWSVEQDQRTYFQQSTWNLGVSLYHRELAGYLNYLLHGNQNFLVLNLDIEGSYKTQLDPAMTSVLMFCWRNPETVVATHSSIGRDTETLWEGIKSLAALYWLAPHATQRSLATMSVRYLETGFTVPVRIALRDLFWIRSILEHALVASVQVGLNPIRSVGHLFARFDEVWQAVAAKKSRVLQIGAVTDSVDEIRGKLERDRLEPLKIGLGVKAAHHVLCNSERPWSIRSTYVKFERLTTPIDPAQWIETTLRAFTHTYLTHINHRGRLATFRRHAGVVIARKTVLWQGRSIWRRFKPRELNLKPRDTFLQSARETIDLLRVETEKAANTNRRSLHRIPRVCKEEAGMPKKKTAGVHFMRNGKLTEPGITEVRKLARRCKTADDFYILGVPRSVPKRTLTAHLAVSRRSK